MSEASDRPTGPDPQVTPPSDTPPDTASDSVDDELADAALALEVDVELLLKEREEYLLLSQQLRADFENYKKRMLKQQTEHVERAAGVLVEKLLPVLDNFDLALAHGEGGVEAVYRSLMAVLEAEGLEKLDPVGKPFDPNEHEAVVHEPADGEGEAGPSVIEVLRPGYRWKGRLLRAAMVKVRG